MVVQFLSPKFLGGQSMQEGNRRQHIAMGLHRDILRREDLLKEPPCRKAREPPVVAPAVHVVAADLADAGEGGEKHSAWFENPIKMAQSRPHVVNELKCLSKDNAVKGVRREVVGTGQVCNDGRLGVALLHMEHVALYHPLPAKAPGVGVVADLQDMSPNIRGVGSQEVLNVVAVNALSPVEAELAADRLKPAQATEAHKANRWPEG